MEGGSCVTCVSKNKKPLWSMLELSLTGMLNKAKINKELYSDFSLFYNDKQFAERFLEALCLKGPKDPNGPLNIANYGELKYFNYGLMGKIGYHDVREKIWRMEKPKEVFEDLKKITKNLLKKPEERVLFGNGIKTLERVAAFLGQCAYD